VVDAVPRRWAVQLLPRGGGGGRVRTADAGGQAHDERAAAHGFGRAGARHNRAFLTPTLSGIARDRVGGGLTAHFYVRSAGSASCNVADGARMAVTSG
jgi:hypothetical protein